MILGIYGSQGAGQEVCIVAQKINAIEGRWENIVFIDDINNILEVRGKKVYSFQNLIQKYPAEALEVIIAVGEPALREKMYNRLLEYNLSFATIIHPGIYIDDTTSVGKGVVIGEGATITCNIKIEDNAYIQPHAVVGHDIKIGKHSVIGSNSQIGGNNVIGERVFMGFLSGTKEHLNIGSDVIISAGAIVFNDLPDSVIVVGNPARIVKRNDDKKVFK